MTIIVDYRCVDCGSTGEAYLASPPPSTLSCAACGGESRRRWSPVGMISRAPDAPPAPKRAPGNRSLCAENPDVPGLCHMSPAAGRAWVARARGDNRALDAELAAQEKAAAVTKPTMADAISHEHTHSHV
ncbi:FmdB family zinc ribbon protein [Herbiconiux ginsengi]|uniref:Uncharacterized protein n=1 Tax=Herbiconiux ginsengi TaxID=381665 RepID=A0A1H3NE29_9MICO|nr:zinc ribbon domain-containing protein [Herbiconiux ginsengi]SDY87014.1 hypothetical protein SAMN05216554_1810 [Herbiconiux ginsengi]